MIKAVIFDLGGVCFIDATQRVIEMFKSDYGIPEERSYDVLSVKSEIGKLYRKGKISSREFWSKALAELGAKEDYRRFLKAWVDSPEIKGTVNIARKLNKKGVKLFFLSDNVKERADILHRKFKVMKYFRDGIFSNVVRKIKSEGKELFLMALNKTGEEAKDVVYIDDKPENVKMAEKVGMIGIDFKNPEQLEKELKLLGIKF